MTEILMLFAAFTAKSPTSDQSILPMDTIAASYVQLVLDVGQHDPNYVDAYYGPSEWQEQAIARRVPLDEIRARTQSLIDGLDAIGMTARMDEMAYLRHQYLTKQLQSLRARVEMLSGKRLSFDEESAALYDATSPRNNPPYFAFILSELDAVLPRYDGKSTLQERYEQFRSVFVIPVEKLDAVFSAAIEECRKRTKRHLSLPQDETFTVEYITAKPWSAYNWYKGGSRSVIQVNTELPIYIDRAIDLAAHEGYPGHHVYNVLLEDNLLRKRGWVEFSVYALFSPQSLIAEGSANYGIKVAFSREERLGFERDVLFPLAGLDASKVEMYYRVADLSDRLAYADNEAARRYLDGEMSRDRAVQFLMKYRLMSRERAEQRLRFIDTYRSYVINYNLGQDLVRQYIESREGTSGNQARIWEEFAKLLSSPRLPSGLR